MYDCVVSQLWKQRHNDKNVAMIMVMIMILKTASTVETYFSSFFVEILLWRDQNLRYS